MRLDKGGSRPLRGIFMEQHSDERGGSRGMEGVESGRRMENTMEKDFLLIFGIERRHCS